MATFFEDRIVTDSGNKVKVRVPSFQGGTDRTIYINGSDSGFYLGNTNNNVYRNGQRIADSLVDFVKTRFGGSEKFEVAIFAPLFFIAKFLYFV